MKTRVCHEVSPPESSDSPTPDIASRKIPALHLECVVLRWQERRKARAKFNDKKRIDTAYNYSMLCMSSA
jgi:hypothetical protein